MEQRIAYALRHDPVIREAEIAEGINPDKNPDPASLADRSRRRADVKRSGRQRGARRSDRAKL